MQTNHKRLILQLGSTPELNMTDITCEVDSMKHYDITYVISKRVIKKTFAQNDHKASTFKSAV
jgi:hypothetical protein